MLSIVGLMSLESSCLVWREFVFNVARVRVYCGASFGGFLSSHVPSFSRSGC